LKAALDADSTPCVSRVFAGRWNGYVRSSPDVGRTDALPAHGVAGRTKSSIVVNEPTWIRRCTADVRTTGSRQPRPSP